MEEVGFKTYTAAHHQGVIEMLWLHFWGLYVNNHDQDQSLSRLRQELHFEGLRLNQDQVLSHLKFSHLSKGAVPRHVTAVACVIYVRADISLM